MMARLPLIHCPICSQPLESDEFEPSARGGARRASDYQSCLRRCDRCGIGLSNAKTDDVKKLAIIYRDPFASLPNELREGCEETLEQALNFRNRPTKRVKFASSNSEDRVTWSVFRSLQLAGALGIALGGSGVGPNPVPATEPALLLWGVPVPSDGRRAGGVRQRLVEICDQIGEHPQGRTEPDVIVDFGPAGLVVIEVKYKSKNDVKAETYRGWDTYLTDSLAFLDSKRVRRSGLYELARNWRLGWELAEERPFTLVNLGPEKLFAGQGGSRLGEFREGLHGQVNRRFELLTWDRLLGEIPDREGGRDTMENDKVRRVVENLRQRAEALLQDPEKLKKLSQAATEKAQDKARDPGPLAGVWEHLTALIRLLRAYARGEYKEIPWGSMVLIVAAIIYFVNPFDLIPDVIPFVGYVDDALVIGFVIRQIRTELDRFREWEARQQQAEPSA